MPMILVMPSTFNCQSSNIVYEFFLIAEDELTFDFESNKLLIHIFLLTTDVYVFIESLPPPKEQNKL